MRDRYGVGVQTVVGDVGADATRAGAARCLPRTRHPRHQQRGPAPSAYGSWDRDAWIAALDANLIAPMLMIRAVLDGMVERRFGRIVNITSAMVKAPVGAMGLSSGARAATRRRGQGRLA